LVATLLTIFGSGTAEQLLEEGKSSFFAESKTHGIVH
jgi:hypothetical protein